MTIGPPHSYERHLKLLVALGSALTVPLDPFMYVPDGDLERFWLGGAGWADFERKANQRSKEIGGRVPL